MAASRSNAWSNGWGTTFFNSELTAGKLLSVDAGRDWSLTGAKATGETVLARVGSAGAGNFSITSPLDESFYQAKEQSFGFNASIPIPGMGAGGSFSLSASQLKLLAENESIKQQSSVVAGTGGLDIRVTGHTHLKGAAVASKAGSYFETQTLTHEDVQSRDVVSGSSWSVSLNLSSAPADAKTDSKGAMAGSAVGYARIDTNETFTTQSSIAGGVNLTRPDLQANNVAAMKAKERDPLASARSDKQSTLNQLLWNEPPRCDGCQYDALPTEPAAVDASPRVATKTATTGAATSATANRTGSGGEGAIDYDGSNSQWLAWQRAVNALEREIAGLDGRIATIDAKVYQDRGSLSTSPSGLHQPLLHTFDKDKATQELRDGVAVTAAFGKAAYKFAGDKAGEYETQAKRDCANGSASACVDAERWGEGGRYRAALHAAIGGISYGSGGAVGAGAGQAMLNAMTPELFNALGITDANAINVLKNLGVTLAGVAAGSAAGAAEAFNADANNRQLHHWQYKLMKSGCTGQNTASLDCARLLAMEGVRADPPASLAGVSGVLIAKTYDASGNVVGAILSDASGQPFLIMDKQDYDKIMSVPQTSRSGALITSFAVPPLRGLACNDVSLTCEAKGGATRSELDDLFRMGQGKYTVFYNGSDINLKDFIFKNDWPAVGGATDMVVDWAAMREKYPNARLWADDMLDVTKFGSIKVQRVDANNVQILADDYDFDLKLDPSSRMRDALTALQGARAGGFSIGNRLIGPGRAFTIVIRGLTSIGP